ncbi:MAG: P-loop NTPase family protein [Gemmatimonadales bacterium]
MQLVERALKRFEGVISGDAVEWEKYLKPSDKARIIPAETLAEECKKAMLLGTAAEPGLMLPWEKTAGKVLLRPGTLNVWAGWSRHGKTRMLKQLMLHAIAKSEKPLICSMEENVRGVWKDLAKMACGSIDPSPKQIDRFVEFVRGNLWLYDQQGMVQPERLQALLRYAAAELKITHAMVDSLMMLAIGREDYEKQGRFCAELKTIANDTGLCIHLVAHMRKRDGKTGEDAPGSIHDVFGGHEIASVADSVFVVWRDMKGIQPAALKVDKQRGDIDWLGTMSLNYHEASRQFVEDVHAMRFWDDSIPF